ncbi:hypothetical protein KC332_g5392 [Hortaea werneckii]|nr:hypothetical protein KC350_g13329 [Hortaea werneckii]KAI6825257.1 hypothetical protein KC358_g8053 [Hortaea werneckii]KAI6939475.1 hypothetical protein KC341_g4157 [Hortaea werneckii]KAI6942219.1 hypothetical protein KC348_g4490 [Hortaea werneckii]KAI6973002.1 hypothetical protein KC321_g5927 [Hortaea werneckii]
MFSRLLPRTVARGAFQAQNQTPQILRASPVTSHLQGRISQRRGYATPSEEKDLVIVGGGVAGYVAAIKAGQEGLKARGMRRKAWLSWWHLP